VHASHGKFVSFSRPGTGLCSWASLPFLMSSVCQCQHDPACARQTVLSGMPFAHALEPRP
jgi:hypothetical protein